MTIVMPIGWTFGFFMMTNARLTSELHKVEIELRDVAATDFLTGALNRRSFLENSQREYERSRRNGQPIVVLEIDIDHFKDYNDHYGHLAGDDMLCAIVAAFRANLRVNDWLARWGGEEFAILLPDIDQAGGLAVAEKLRGVAADLRVPVGSEQTHATISVGGALWKTADENWGAVLHRADNALYQAKQRGRNCVVML
jgi:diguanylate cyclase (GGDEF)-like protein